MARGVVGLQAESGNSESAVGKLETVICVLADCRADCRGTGLGREPCGGRGGRHGKRLQYSTRRSAGGAGSVPSRLARA
eukprot:5989260-Prymnesium_polylepis.1